MPPRTQSQPAAGAVAEIQGLYGPFSFPEKLLQKIWARGDFNRAAAVTADGQRVTIFDPGKWNLLGGPDFRDARLRFDDGREITGDVELHLQASDWAAHAHARDPAYDAVALHVVLFPPEPGHVTLDARGRGIPVLALLPLLHHDLEEFAADDAVERLAGRDREKMPAELAAFSAAELATQLRQHAAARWRQKVHFARLRVQRLGWDAACHHAALEILGYRFNRAPMLRLAARWPLADWGSGVVEPAEIFATEKGGWSLQGVRPANHPRVRLRQYAAWARAQPDWPQQLAGFAQQMPEVRFDDAATTASVRQAHRLADLRKRWAALGGGAIGGTRLDNLICDGFLPLLAAGGGRDEALHGVWFHWWPGDLPPRLLLGLRELEAVSGRARPACHGAGQGLLGWLVERAARR